MSIFDNYKKDHERSKVEYMSFDEYLDLCKEDKGTYALPAERMIKAIGDPELVDTSSDPRLSRVFQNRTIRRYPAFKEFYGMEDAIERIVGFFKHAAQGLEERKQVLYLLGPVGGGKSSLAERIKSLMEEFPIYCLALEDGTLSPVLESPLGVFRPESFAEELEKDYGIEKRYLTGLMSPWAIKRLEEFEGDVSKFRVAKVYPSKLKQIGICKTEPGDENNQDISSLVGKTDIRKLEFYSQDDPDAYSFSGGLCKSNQGLLEFVEMFKAPIKVLHPLLTATQEGNYVGTEGITAIPFQGVILAHSNESEWQTFKNNKNNEAFLDRIFVVKVPYCLRVDEEVDIYQKMIRDSGLGDAPCAPQTLDLLAQFSILTRIKEHENSNKISKMKVYNGENVRDSDTRAKSMTEYKDTAGVDEGMEGISTRFAFKILSKTFNFDPNEVAADPVHMMYVLEDAIRREQYSPERETELMGYIKDHIAVKYAEFIGNEIQKAYLESYDEYGQSVFDRYIEYADHWIQNIDYKDGDTGQMFDRTVLNDELEKIEKPAGIVNAKDFRNEVVNFVIRAKAANDGKSPRWSSYEKLREVIEKKIFSNTEDLLPIISFGSKSTSDDAKKHEDFVRRMEERGYTERRVKRLTEWFIRVRKAS